MMRTLIAELGDGRQILVAIYGEGGDDDGPVEVAIRNEPGDVWGMPLPISLDSAFVSASSEAEADELLDLGRDPE
jgi:hypothetical protein